MSVKILKFATSWCGPCKMMAPVMEQFAAETGADVQNVDADTETDLVAKYNIRGVPTLVFLVDDQVVKTLVGYNSKKVIEDTYAQITV